MAFTYKGLEGTLRRHTVTNEELQQQLQRLIQATPKITPVLDRPTQSGDEIVLDYAGFCGDEQFPGGTAQNQTLVLGSGSFIPGFEEQLLNKDCGEEVTVLVTFPAEYHAPELAGKDAKFICKIHEIRVKTPYQLDDTFAKEVGGCERLTEMEEKMRLNMQNFVDQRGEMDLQDSLLRQAAETLEFKADQEALDKAADEQLKAMEAQLAQQGLSLEMYCSFMSTTPDKLKEDAYPAAEAALRTQAAVEKIAQLENLTITEEEKGQAVELIAQQNGITVEQLSQYYSPEFEKALLGSIMTTKVMQLIRDNAIIQ